MELAAESARRQVDSLQRLRRARSREHRGVGGALVASVYESF